MVKQFCDWHIKTKENPDGTDCSAHLHESRCYKCSYTPNDIKYKAASDGFYISHTSSDLIGACQDFKLTGELESRLNKVSNDEKLEALLSFLNS
jgi:hypothetical protein